MNKHIKSHKGITLISLVLTIVITLILSTVVVSNVNIRKDIGERNNMYADIVLLEEKILIYYNKYNLVPKTDITFTTMENVISILDTNRNINDNDIYYRIDFGALQNVTTNYGTEKLGQDDIYIINDKTLTIYYLKGIEFDGQNYYRYPYNYSQIS